MSLVVGRWTGREAAALRDAMRCTVEEFAATLGVSPRAVAAWEARGSGITPLPESQAVLDTALARAAADVRARFAVTVPAGVSSSASPGAAQDAWPSAPVRPRGVVARRHVLAGIAGLVVPLVGPPLPAPGPAEGDTAPGAGLAAELRDRLLRRPLPSPGGRAPDRGDHGAALAEARRGLASCMAAYQHSRYGVLRSRLPGLLDGVVDLAARTPAAQAVVAETWNAAARFFVKVETPGPGWMCADRALAAAAAAGDPVVHGSVMRTVATLLRRDGQHTASHDVALDAAARVADGWAGRPGPGEAELSVYGTLLCTAAYSAARAGDRSRSGELLDQATSVAQRVGHDRNAHWTAFTPTNVRLYRVSCAHALGDFGTAVEIAARVAPANVALPERRSRLWVDVARCLEQWGRPEPALHALLTGERSAGEEVRSRPVVRLLVERLVRSGLRSEHLPGLARRVGART